MVNVYLVEEPLTLIDTGTKSRDARNVLEASLRSVGYDFGDIQRIVLTHAHVDHFGLASEIREVSSADIYAPKIDKPTIEGFRMVMEKSGRTIVKMIRRHGFPEKTATRIGQYHKMIMSAGDDVDVDLELHEGDTINFDWGDLKVIHTPAHTQGSVSLLGKDDRLFAGDTVLEDYSGEGVFSLMEPSAGLTAQMEALERLRRMKISLLLPGHGEPASRGSKGLIAKRIREIRGMMQDIPPRLDDWKTPVEISMELFGDLKIMQVPFAIREVMDVCAHLLSRGEIVMKEDRFIMFRAVGV